MLVTMPKKALHRIPVIHAVIDNSLRRGDAASQLALSEPPGSAAIEPLSQVWRRRSR
ncbi:hypothetical protein NVIRENTERO_02349 [Sodalis praecaptivus]|nr:hypothetical protein NVIRENTERO_02349 [Sodalis praecaptivus]